MNYKEINKEVWNQNVKDEHVWSKPVSSEMVQAAREGEWSIVLTPKRNVPRTWFPEKLSGMRILCLASGGGQQGPILSAAGAEVTVFDYSEGQLSQDEMVAKRDGLQIRTVKGDMCDLSVFDDETFDMVVHPWSNCFIEDVIPVWKEAYRVLKNGGILIAGFANPISYIFDYEAICRGEFDVKYSIPYSDLTSLTEQELKETILDQGEAVCFGHSLEDQIQGQISAGFVIAGFLEDIAGNALDKYINSSIMTKSVKL